MKDGINFVVAVFLRRAKEASKDARRELARYRSGANYAFELYLRYRCERSDWLYAVRLLLRNTTDGVVTEATAERVMARWRAKWKEEAAETADLRRTGGEPSPDTLKGEHQTLESEQVDFANVGVA